jgi:TP901 family phage tail tape measure protein
MARDKSVIQVVVTGEASRLQRAMKGAGSILGTFAAIGLKAAAVTAQLATAIGVAGVRQFANFDAAMQKSVAIMGDVSDAMRKDMSDAAREVAKTTTFSAEQAAESYFFLASAGLSAEQSIAALPKVAAFAQAGMFDMARATDLLTDAQSALGLTSDDATENLENMTRISDVLVKANTLANASVSQFSEALTNKAGAALRVLGKDVEEGTAVLAFFADQGVKGAEAGEMLNIMLRDVTRAAAGNAKEFDKLGLSVLDSDGNLKNMADVVDEFTRVLGPMSDAQMAATLDQLGLTRAVGNSIRQTLGGADAIREYEAALRGASGATEEVAEKQLDTFNAQLGLLRSAVGDVFLSIGERLVPVFSGLVGAIQENMPAIEAFADKMLDAFDGTVLPILQAVSSFIQENIGPAISAFAGFFKDELLPVIRTQAAFFEENFLPVIRTLAGIVMDNVLPAFKSFAKFVLDVLVPGARNFLRPVLEALNVSLGNLRGFIDRNKDGFQDFFTSVRPIFEWIRDTGAPILGIALGGVIKIVSSLVAGLIGTFNVLLKIISKVVDAIRKFVSTVAESAIGRGLSNIIDTVTGRQFGGLVTPNRPFLVGEQGPELFVPMGAGRIMPEVPMLVPEVELGNGGRTDGPTIVNITVTSADPQAVVEAIRRYTRANGPLGQVVNV